MSDVFSLIEKGVVKRYFRARKKPSFKGAISHVTQHASGTGPLFLETSDYLYMLHLMKEVSKKFNFNILSFTLMLNHIHLFIKLHCSNLSGAMKNLFERYAMYFNNKYDRKGHVFSGSYRSALCFSEAYLLAISLYIHLNPVRKGLVAFPDEYRWSSCRLFVTDINRDTFVNYRFILDILDSDILEARMKYREALEKVRRKIVENALEKSKPIESIIEILKDEKTDIEIEKLKTKNRLRKSEDKKMRVVMIKRLKARDFNITEIAQRLNLSRSAVYKAIK